MRDGRERDVFKFVGDGIDRAGKCAKRFFVVELGSCAGGRNVKRRSARIAIDMRLKAQFAGGQRQHAAELA